MNKIEAVPTNIISGFLGVGKTTAILHLLKTKPECERWAVLVNEFGEIGIDGALIEGQSSNKTGVYMREVPGGCMCCTSSLPMQVALNQLLKQAQPDRLLIEPSGLGHPQEVLEVLLSEQYNDVLDLQASLTLFDARHLQDEKYITHDIFQQQFEIADVLVANKNDLYSEDDKKFLTVYLDQAPHLLDKIFYSVKQGKLNPDWLNTTNVFAKNGGVSHTHNHNHNHNHNLEIEPQALMEQGYIVRENQGEGFKSYGWCFNPAWTFDYKKLYAFLNGLKVERLKAVFITDEGVFTYNGLLDSLTEQAIDDCFDSRLEIINYNHLQITDDILNCLIKN